MKYDYHEDFVLMYRRSRKGAWIEMFSYAGAALAIWVAPARERGLKSPSALRLRDESRSLPQGSVD